MKVKEKKEAIQLRKLGYSLKTITQRLNVSKSSVSLWVRDVQLTKSQLSNLTKRQHARSVVEKRRKTRLLNSEVRKSKVINKAVQQIKPISQKDLFLVGVSLYLGEGSKKKQGVVEFVNGDPELIMIMMRFFREVCEIQDTKFRIHIHLHCHISPVKAEKYWSKITGVPRSQFFKTSQQHNISSKSKKDSLPNGTVSIYVCSTQLQLMMKGWMKGLTDVINLNK